MFIVISSRDLGKTERHTVLIFSKKFTIRLKRWENDFLLFYFIGLLVFWY